MTNIDRYHLVIVGDGSCGKTSILTVFRDEKFPDEHVPTVFETTCKQMQMDDSTNIEFTLWDTAGQEDYDKLRPLSYNGKHVVLICFSVDRPSSLANVENQWSKEVQHFCKTTPVILVGNKIDLRQTQNGLLATESTQTMAKKIKANAWMECSAKTGENIEELFRLAGKQAENYAKSKKKKDNGCCTLL